MQASGCFRNPPTPLHVNLLPVTLVDFLELRISNPVNLRLATQHALPESEPPSPWRGTSKPLIRLLGLYWLCEGALEMS